MSKRTAHGHDFEEEFADSIQLLVEWCEHLGLNHRHLDYHKIIDTSLINLVGRCRKKHCGESDVICAACGAPREYLPAPKAPADFTWDTSNKVYEVECKSSMSSKASFPMQNIKQHQMDRCLALTRSNVKDYIWAICDRRSPGNYEMYMAYGEKGLAAVQEVTLQMGGRASPNYLRWKAFAIAAAQYPHLVSQIPRAPGQELRKVHFVWDLTYWFYANNLVAPGEPDCVCNVGHMIPHMTDEFVSAWRKGTLDSLDIQHDDFVSEVGMLEAI